MFFVNITDDCLFVCLFQDWWALGVIMYEMLYGNTPFQKESSSTSPPPTSTALPTTSNSSATTVTEIFNNIRSFVSIQHSKPQFTALVANQEISQDVYDLISHLLNPKEKERYGVSGTMSHSFFHHLNWDTGTATLQF